MRIATIIAAAVAASLSGYVRAEAAATDGPPTSAVAEELQTVVVTGSRIPRIEAEGPSPVVTITAADILNNGFANTADIMSSLTQNLGALDNNQYTNGFSPGAQAVDLRGLGPNHTLVLVNGRRIADYPQAYGGNSNFTDISNIPSSLLDRVEILSGSDSAIYGSDAVSGVINFIMKKRADGTTIDFRDGETQHGGGSSQRLTITSGYSNDRFDSIFSVELLNQQPLWAFQRSFTDSRLDSAVDPSGIRASPVFLREDVDGYYLDPGQATCNSLAHLDNNSVFRASRPDYGLDPGPNGDYPGYWCGSYNDVGYGTLENGRQAINFYGSASYRLNDQASLFMDVQAADSHQISHNGTLKWANSFAQDGTSVPVPFDNQATGQVEQWTRQYFTLEENGGLDAGKIHNDNVTFSINAGIKGAFNADWSYEALLGYSQNKLKETWPVVISAKAQELYLGHSLGTDADGYQIFNAPVSRLYTPLTPAQFASITTDSLDEDTSRTQNLSFTLNNSHLWTMPAGPVGFAGVAEYGHDSLKQEVDPGSLDGTYYQYHNTAANGSRNRFGAGLEFRIPLLSSVILNAATRYDEYRYSGNASGKATYNGGLEWRPLRTLLVRGSIGTGFRAPDLSYLYAGESGSSSGGIDYYQCSVLQQDPDTCDLNDVSFNGASHGSIALKDETSVSYTYGFVFSPTKDISFNADYYNIALTNEVLYQDSDTILREEAACRTGELDPNSAFCQQVVSQVTRMTSTNVNNPNPIVAVHVLPINAASERTSGLDMGAHWHIEAGRAGGFDLSGGYTHVIKHTIQLSAEQPVDDQLTDLYYYVIPKDKATYSAGWTLGKFTTTIHGNWLGGIPNYDGDKRLSPTEIYNASATYRFSERGAFTFFVDNLFDTKPPRDPTWVSYPYYSRNWFSPVGRAFFFQANYRFGGTPTK